MELKESLKKLKKLEQLQDEIDQNKKDRDRLHLDIDDQEDKVEELKTRRETIKEERTHALKEADRRETQMAAAQEENEKLEIQRNSTKNQAQFKAMGETIAGNKADIEKWENEELEFLEESDQLKQEAEDIAEQIEQEEQKLDDIKQRVRNKAQEYDEAIEELEERKRQIREEVAPSVLEKYDNISRSRGSSALVKVKNRVCQGCHTMLPKQTENELMKGSEIIFCHNCGRMLMI